MADEPIGAGVLQSFAGLVADASEWLAELLGDDIARRAVLRDLGLDPIEGQTVDTQALLADMESDVTAVRSYATANVDQADAAALVSAVESIKNVVDLLANLLEAVSTDTNEARKMTEVVASLMQLYVVQRVRDVGPGWYAFARAAQILTDEALLVDWDRVGEFLGDFLAAFRFRTEDEASLASPWLAALVTIVGLMFSEFVRDHIADDGPTDMEKFGVVYGWDPDPTLAAEFLPAERIAQRTVTMFFGDQLGGNASLSVAFVPRDHGGPGMVVGTGGQVVLGSRGHGPTPEPGTSLTVGAGLLASAFLPLGASVGASALGPHELTVALGRVGPRTRSVLGPSDATRLEVGQIVCDLRVTGNRLVLRWGVSDATLIVGLGNTDNFLTDLIDAREIRIPFELVLGIDSANGFFVQGGTGLTATIPVNGSFAGLRIDHIALQLQLPSSGTFRLDVTAAVGLDLGMFQATVDQIGFSLDLNFSGSSMGFADVKTQFRPPKGIGLTFGFAGASGGGYLYLDPAKGEYAGVLQIDFGSTGLKALGILTTKGLPADGWALLLVLFATVTPPVNAMGWHLTGLGAIAGVNHTASDEAFREGLRTKALDDVLFPTDPVSNAVRILATLRTVFPIEDGGALIGFAAEWQYLKSRRVTVRVGVILQGHPDPERIVILGQLKVSAPGEKNGIITLNADLYGSIEWGEESLRIAVDTRLFDSKIGAQGLTFAITGSLSVRVTIGRNAMIMFTAGGFHPDFDVPADLRLPAKLDRFGFKLSKGPATLTLAGYAALTPCTLQFGVQIDLVARKFGFSVEANLGIHALLDQEQGRFSTKVEISAALKRGSTTLMKVELKFALSGPGRWRAAGSAKFKLWFFSKTICFDESWGDEPGVILPLVDALAALVVELTEVANWSGLPAGKGCVALREGSAAAGFIHPLSDLSVHQRLLPLGVELDRIGSNRISGPSRLDITGARLGAQRFEALMPVRSDFARGQFLDLTDDQALSLPSFEPMRSGVVVAAAPVAGGRSREQPVSYETVYPFAEDAPPQPVDYEFPFGQVVLAAEFGAVARSTTSPRGTSLFASELPDLAVSVRDRSYLLVDADTMSGNGESVGRPLHEALDRLAAAREDGTRVVLVETHEVMA